MDTQNQTVNVDAIQDSHFTLTSSRYRDARQKFVWFKQDYIRRKQQLETERKQKSRDMSRAQLEMETRLYQLTIAREQTRLERKLRRKTKNTEPDGLIAEPEEEPAVEHVGRRDSDLNPYPALQPKLVRLQRPLSATKMESQAPGFFRQHSFIGAGGKTLRKLNLRNVADFNSGMVRQRSLPNIQTTTFGSRPHPEEGIWVGEPKAIGSLRRPRKTLAEQSLSKQEHLTRTHSNLDRPLFKYFDGQSFFTSRPGTWRPRSQVEGSTHPTVSPVSTIISRLSEYGERRVRSGTNTKQFDSQLENLISRLESYEINPCTGDENSVHGPVR